MLKTLLFAVAALEILSSDGYSSPFVLQIKETHLQCQGAVAREVAGDIIGAVDTGQECQALRCHGACTRDATVVSRELSFCFLFILNVD